MSLAPNAWDTMTPNPWADYLFDEIGSVLKIKQYQEEKKEMLEALELYYRTFFLGEDIDIEDDGED